MECCICNLIGFGVLIFVLKFLYDKWQDRRTEEKLQRWSNTPKDLVILHSLRRGLTCPSPSPYVLKVETYLRMCGIKYEVDIKDKYGPKGKFPWISLNGEHVADSQFIVEFISKKFGKSFSKNIPEKTLAIARMCRVAFEEHFFWGFGLQRYVLSGRHELHKFMQLPMPYIMRWYAFFVFRSRSRAQGVGRHSEPEIVHLMTTNLRSLSAILGTNDYICGDELCEEDAALFAMLAQVIWTLPNSAYDKLIKSELPNLEAYCQRIKTKYWPDWNDCLLKT